jgi:hypothetical protein
MVVLGVCGAGRGTVNYLYLLELMPKERKVVVGTSANAINEFTYVWSSLLFRYIS